MADQRLLIVAPDPLVRAGLATLLGDRPGFDLVGQLSGDQTLPTEIDVFRPDVLIWDLGWEPGDNLSLLSDVTADLGDDGPGIIVLLPDEERAVQAWSAGARGLLLRDTAPERLLAAAAAVANGLTVAEPNLLGSLAPPGPWQEPEPAEALTPREMEVLQLLTEGLANKAIAQRLGISEYTVKFHVNAIMSKLGVQSRTAAVVRATRLGLILL